MIDTTRHQHVTRAGFYFHHDTSGLIPITPSWDRRTIFKPIGIHVPGLDHRDNHNWYHVLSDAVRSAGVRRRINFLNRPSDFDGNDLEPTPYDLLRQCAWTLSRDARPDWQWMFKRDRTRHLALPNAQQAVLIQAWVYAIAGRDLRNEPMTDALILLSPGAIMSMSLLLLHEQAVDQLFDPATPHALDLYRSAEDFTAPEGWGHAMEMERPTDEDMALGGARHMICRMLSVDSTMYLPTPTPQHHQGFWGWDTVVRRLTAAEQLKLLATAFPADLMTATFVDSKYERDLPTHLLGTPGGETSGLPGSGGGGQAA